MDLPEEGVIAGFDAAANRPFRAIESAAAHLVLVVHGIGISKMEDFEGSVQLGCEYGVKVIIFRNIAICLDKKSRTSWPNFANQFWQNFAELASDICEFVKVADFWQTIAES